FRSAGGGQLTEAAGVEHHRCHIRVHRQSEDLQHHDLVVAGVDWESSDGGAVFVHGSTLWLECAPFKRVDAGDHEIVVLQIL
ncbi:hypothetical protein C6A85_11815, partial [Mycobacterium sp. ITM-2017-0098]